MIVECLFRILGPPEIYSDRRDVALAPRLWCVFASLLLAPNVTVTADVMIDRLWGDSPSGQARNSLSAYVSQIGRTLKRTEHGVRIEARRHGYALIVDPNAIDLHRFRSLKRQADAMAASGDSGHAVLLLDEADALWRGEALSGLSADWVARIRVSLEEERHAAVLRRVELGLLLGRHVELLGELSRLSDEHPLDETVAEYLMTALYRAGRPNDALRTYRDVRARMVEQGIEPGDSLAELELRILRRDERLSVTPAHRRPDEAAQPNLIPPGPRSFVGREEEIRQLTQASLGGNLPLLRVIEGAAGVGKTALAIQVAHQLTWRYPDAQIYLNFHSHDLTHRPIDVAEAVHRLLRMLEVPHQRIPGDLEACAGLWRSELAYRRAIVILDDVAGPDQIGPLLPLSGDCLIVVVSRRRHPDWAGTKALPLDVLPADDAATLFAQIAGPYRCQDSEQVAEAVRLCGRLPLAIHIAASRIRNESPFTLTDLIGELADFVETRSRTDMVTRQLAAAFEVSCQGLTRSQQQFFRYLGISPTVDLTVHAAMALTGGTLIETETALSALQDRHLLGQPSPGRFQLHDLIRSYAAFRCEDEDAEADRGHALVRLLHYYEHAVDYANRVIHPGRVGTATASGRLPAMETAVAARTWLDSEWRNVLRLARHAARHERKRQCATLTHAVGQFLETSGYWSEAVAAHTLALEACRDVDDLPGIARASFDLSLPTLRTGQHELALRHANEALAVYRTVGDSRGQVAALDRMGLIHRYLGHFREALAFHQEASEMAQLTGNEYGTAQALCHAGTVYHELGRYEQASAQFAQALALYRRLGDRRGEAKTLNNVGAVQDEQGLHRDAMSNYQAAMDIFLDITGRQSISLLRQNIGRIRFYKGKYAEALTAYREALGTYRAVGDLKHEAHAMCDIGDAYQALECPSEALIHHEKAKSIADTIGDPRLSVTALCGMAEAHRDSGQQETALDQFDQAARMAREIEAPYLEAKALQGMAETMLRMGRPEMARIYLRSALDLCRRLGILQAESIALRLDSLGTSAS